MRTTIRTRLAIVCAVALLAAACGGDGDTASETAGGTAGETDAATSLLDGEIPCEQQYAGRTVSIFSPARNSENDRPVDDNLAAFQALVDCTGVELDWQGTDQFETEINVRLEGGDPPDVIDYPQPGLMTQHARRGFVLPLPDDVAAHLATDYLGGWDTYGTVDGTEYALPTGSNFKSLVWYSPPAFEAAGYEVPETLEDLKALSDQIVADGGIPWCAGAESGVATGWVLTDWMEDFMLRTHGEDVYDQWVNHEIPFNDPRVAEVVDAVGAYLKNPDYVGGENSIKAIATTKFQDGGLPILEGDCYMHRQGSFYKDMWTEGTTVGDDGDVSVFYLPSPADGPAYVLGAGGVIAAATDKPESYDVVRFAGSVLWQNALAESRGALAPHKDLDLDLYADPFTRRLAELQIGADVFRFDGSDLMPGVVGAGTFWTEATAWVIGGSTQDFVDNVEASWPS